MALVLIDLDGTLISGPTCEGTLLVRLVRERLLGARQVVSGVTFFFRWAPSYGPGVWKRNKGYLNGLSVGVVEHEARRLVEDSLARRIRPFMRRRLAWHRARNHTLVLLSGAPDFLARPMAERLGIPHCVATVCAQAAGRFTAEPPEVHPVGPEKLRIAQELCHRFGCSLDDCTAYADSFSDAALLERVGKPVPVNPDRSLSRMARRAGWAIATD